MYFFGLCCIMIIRGTAKSNNYALFPYSIFTLRVSHFSYKKQLSAIGLSNESALGCSVRYEITK
jgi:hypothetical protein